MTNENKALAIIPRTLDEVQTLADRISKSTLLPDALRNKVPDVLMSIMTGQELGLAPMAAIRGVHIIKGKPILTADTMVALVLGSGLAEFFRPKGEATVERATYETRRKGDTETHTCTWTLADAKLAQLVEGDNWKKNPRAMLKARAKAMLARDIYPDVLAGCYEEDEAREMAFSDSPAGGVIDAEVIERQPLPSTTPAYEIADALIADIERAATVAEIDALAPRFAALAKGSPERARAYEVFKGHRADQEAREAAPVEGVA